MAAATKCIEAGITREGDTVVISIRDHGPGVAEKDLPHVKEKFYKGSSKARGNGIGLAVCDEIITRHERTARPSATPRGAAAS